MTGYAKLFNSIVDSTVWGESPSVCKLWITLLVKADRDGIVDASIPGLARAAILSVQEVEAALQKFLSPDPYSRTPDHEGRRIEVVDGGWRLLNYEKYRAKMSPDDIRERDRIRKQRQRDRMKCPTKSGTNRDISEISEKSNTHTQKAQSKKHAHAPVTSPSPAVERVCQALNLTGKRNRASISEVVAMQVASTGQSEENVADRMLDAWEQHRGEKSGFRYDSAIAYYQSGLWLTVDVAPRKVYLNRETGEEIGVS